jgi:hypothetical protein
MKERWIVEQDLNSRNYHPDLLPAATPEPLKKVSESGAISGSDVVDLILNVENLFAIFEIFLD